LSLISSNGELILLYKNMPMPKKANSYDLVLSPQFYIVKNEQLPIKYSYQAKRLAASILDDYLDSNKQYEYIVQKTKDGWKFFAYSPKEVEEYLENNYNISAKKISQVYFADQLLSILSKAPISLDENSALALLDNQATIIPKSMLEDVQFVNFSKKLRPKGGFAFKSSQKAQKQTNAGLDISSIAIAILLVLISLAYIAEAISYKNSEKKASQKLSLLYKDAPQLQSKLTRDAIKSKYQAIETKQRLIREQLKNFSKLSSKKSLLESLTLNKNSLEASFKVDLKEVNRIKSITTNTNLSYKQEGNIFKIQGALNGK